MSVDVQEELLREAVGRLVDELHPESIYVFGSRAWGNPRDDSDLDIMVIVSDSDEAPTQRETRALRALRGLGVRKDVLVRTRSEFDARACVETLMEARIVKDGRLLYGV